MIRTRSALVPTVLGTAVLALAAGPAVASASAPAAPAPAAAAAERAAIAKEIASTRAFGAGLEDPITLVTRLLGLPGVGSVSALLELLGVPHDDAIALAQRISALATAITTPEGGNLTASATPEAPAAPAPAEPAPAAAEAGTTKAAAPKVTLVRTTLTSALRSGFKVRLAGAEEGPVRLVARTAGKTVATGTGTVSEAGTATVRLRPTAAARKRYAGAKALRVTVGGAGAKATALRLAGR